MEFIWDDIEKCVDYINIREVPYKQTSLFNDLYDTIHDLKKRRELIKKYKTPGLFAEREIIDNYSKELANDSQFVIFIKSLFKENEIESITPLDMIFLNSYFRKLLRAKLERDLMNEQFPKGLVISQYKNDEIDKAIISTLQLMKLICKFLGIESTTHESIFSLQKLYMPSLWRDISNKFVALFGEDRITPIVVRPDPEPDNLDAIAMQEGLKKIDQSKVLLFLKIIFNTWSGSDLILDGDNIKIIPARFITRMLPKLQIDYKLEISNTN